MLKVNMPGIYKMKNCGLAQYSLVKHIIYQVLFSCILNNVIYSQEISKQQQDTVKYYHYLKQAKIEKSQSNYADAIKSLLYAVDILENSNDLQKLPAIYINIAEIYTLIGAVDNSADYYLKALNVRNFSDGKQKASIQQNLGEIYTQLKQYDNALEYFKYVAAYYEKQKNNKKLIGIYNIIGMVNRKSANYLNALEADNQLISIANETNDSSLLFTALNNKGYDQVQLKQYQQAIESLLHAYKIGNKNEIPEIELSQILTNIGICSFNISQTNMAIENLKKALSLCKSSYESKARIENLLAVIYLNSDDLYNAGVFGWQSIESAKKSGNKQLLQQCYNIYSQVLKAGNDPIKALEYYEKYLRIRDSLLLEERLAEQETSRKKFDLEKSEKEIRLEIAEENMLIMRLRQSELERQRQKQQLDSLEQATKLASLEYETEKQAAALEVERLNREIADRSNRELQTQNKIQHLEIESRKKDEQQKKLEIKRLETEKKQEQVVKRRAIFIAVLLVLIALTILSGLVVTRKKNTLLARQKKEIEEKNDYLEQLNEEIRTQKETIEEKNTAITDSIIYAKKIQAAVLPSEDFFKENLSDYFILFRPRDIVSGDFYWGMQKNDKIVIVAADCTGHGVPGAFMSMLGKAFLDEIVNDMNKLESDKILNRLRKNVIEALKQKGEEGEAKDGMDIAMCIIDKKNQEIKFSGAFNPLYYIRKNELFEIKADRMPIGIHQKVDNDFTQHELKIQNNDCFYIFSDGYADQFGGTEGKKFKITPFKELLLANYQKPLQKQKEILWETFDTWKKNEDQVDDVLVMGFRV